MLYEGSQHFDAVWIAFWKQTSGLSWKSHVGNVKENSVESVKFSFYRHILNYHFYKKHLDSIQTPLLEKVCTALLSTHKDFVEFLSLSASI